MSEKRSDISERDSRMESASSALTASTALKPASSTISTARIRSTISSSTTRTFGGIEADVMTGLFPLRGKLFDDQDGFVEASVYEQGPIQPPPAYRLYNPPAEFYLASL